MDARKKQHPWKWTAEPKNHPSEKENTAISRRVNLDFALKLPDVPCQPWKIQLDQCNKNPSQSRWLSLPLFQVITKRKSDRNH